MEAPPAPGAGLRVVRAPGSKRDRLVWPTRSGTRSRARPRSGDPLRLAYRYVKIGSPMSIQLKIDAAFGIGTRRHPWLAG